MRWLSAIHEALIGCYDSGMPSDQGGLIESYDDFPRIEEEFQAFLDVSLNPLSSDELYDVVAGLDLPAGASVLDLGCGEGKQSLELATRFGFSMLGVDPVPRNLEVAKEALAAAPQLGERLRFEIGSTDGIPAADSSVDLVWCREVLVLVEDLDTAFAECRRVLREGGRMFIHDTFRTERMLPGEAPEQGAHADRIEAAFTRAGFTVAERIEFTSEWGEANQERTGAAGRRLVHLARLQRDPDRYIARFGQANYDIMLQDCYWHVYRMMGKLAGRVYVLR